MYEISGFNELDVCCWLQATDLGRPINRNLSASSVSDTVFSSSVLM